MFAAAHLFVVCQEKKRLFINAVGKGKRKEEKISKSDREKKNQKFPFSFKVFCIFLLPQLDNCNDYETRRQIRARIKTLLSDVKGKIQIEDTPIPLNDFPSDFFPLFFTKMKFFNGKIGR